MYHDTQMNPATEQIGLLRPEVLIGIAASVFWMVVENQMVLLFRLRLESVIVLPALVNEKLGHQV